MAFGILSVDLYALASDVSVFEYGSSSQDWWNLVFAQQMSRFIGKAYLRYTFTAGPVSVCSGRSAHLTLL